MRLFEIENKKNGTFVGIRYTPESVKKIRNFINEMGIPNSVDDSEIHTTLTCSKKCLEPFECLNDLPYPRRANPSRLTYLGETIVVMIESEWLHNRRDEVVEKYQPEETFKVYKPHITLSYDPGEYKLPPSNINLGKKIGPLYFCKEYVQELDEDFGKD